MNDIEEEYLHDRIERLQEEVDKLEALKDRVQEMSLKYAGCGILMTEFPEIFKD